MVLQYVGQAGFVGSPDGAACFACQRLQNLTYIIESVVVQQQDGLTIVMHLREIVYLYLFRPTKYIITITHESTAENRYAARELFSAFGGALQIQAPVKRNDTPGLTKLLLTRSVHNPPNGLSH